MKNFEETLKVLNNLNITQESIDWIEDLPEKVYEDYLEGVKTVAQNLDVDTHRWYETSIEVFEIDGRFIGVRKISNIFSEMSEVLDMYWTLEFFEMKPVETVTYVPVK